MMFTGLSIKKVPGRASLGLLLVLAGIVPAAAQNTGSLSLQDAVDQALLNDDWLLANEQRENALREEALYSGELPDPMVMVSLMNLPVNTFSFDQEPMTQFRLGITQSFPRGETRALSREQKIRQSEINPYLREDRRAGVTLQVTRLWLDAYLSQESINLINANRALFEQLVDITDSRYRNAAGLARQQDLVRAQLELTRLDDRLAALRQQLENSRQQLARWIPYDFLNRDIAPVLPVFPEPVTEMTALDQAAALFMDHPKVKAQDKQIASSRTGVELAKQGYKPGITLGASYGYRDDGPMGLQRDDFISLEISFDLPLFTEKRQKPKVEAASYTASAMQTERVLLLKNLFADYQQAMSQLAVLDERRTLFNDTLLGQLRVLTEATLAAYTADEGDFAEVTRAYIAELNASIEVLGIDVERLKMLAQLNYLLTRTEL